MFFNHSYNSHHELVWSVAFIFSVFYLIVFASLRSLPNVVYIWNVHSWLSLRFSLLLIDKLSNIFIGIFLCFYQRLKRMESAQIYCLLMKWSVSKQGVFRSEKISPWNILLRSSIVVFGLYLIIYFNIKTLNTIRKVCTFFYDYLFSTILT